MDSGQFTLLKFERNGRILLITLNRPEVLNAFNIELFAQLTSALVAADHDPDVSLVAITGAGRGFSTGADLKSVVEHHATERSRWEGAQTYAQAASDLFRQIRDMSKVVVAMVNGPAYGGGLVLATCCDVAVASENATFRIPEALAGIADELSTVWLVASVGMARAKYLVLTAETLSAFDAQQMGLIAVVCAPEELRRRTLEVCAKVLETGPRARSVFKRIINDRLPEPRTRHIVESHLSNEALEGCKAFAEKRKPDWDAAD